MCSSKLSYRTVYYGCLSLVDTHLITADFVKNAQLPSSLQLSVMTKLAYQWPEKLNPASFDPEVTQLQHYEHKQMAKLVLSGLGQECL